MILYLKCLLVIINIKNIYVRRSLELIPSVNGNGVYSSSFYAPSPQKLVSKQTLKKETNHKELEFSFETFAAVAAELMRIDQEQLKKEYNDANYN